MKFATILAIVLLITNISFAQVPSLISYQGFLTNETGEPVPDNDYSIYFRIFDDPDAGAIIWASDGYVPVPTKDGYFTYLLGTTNPLPDSLTKFLNLWLSVEVGSGGELSPRTQFVSTGYAFKSLESDHSILADSSDISAISHNSYNSDSLGGYTPQMIINMSQLHPLNPMDLTDNTRQHVSGSGIYEVKRTLIISPNSVNDYIVVGFNLRAATIGDRGSNNVIPQGRLAVNGVPIYEVVGPNAFVIDYDFGGSHRNVEGFGLTGVYKFKIDSDQIDFSIENTLTLELMATVSQPPHGQAYNDYWEVWGK